MLYLIIAALLLLVVALLVLLGLRAPKVHERNSSETLRGTFMFWAGLVTAVLVLVTLAYSATTVSARAVGIQTSFGRYQSTLPAGFHMTTPWSGVEEFSTQVQFLELNGAKDNSVGGVEVNYQGGGKGVVDATIRWRIDPENAEALWRKYRQFGAVRDQLVVSASRDSIRVTVGAYAPNDARAGENLRKITGAVQSDLGNQLRDDGIQIDSVSVTGVFLDDVTQKSIEQIVQAENAIKRAQAEKQRAIIDNETAKLRQQAGQLSAGALQRYCLEVTNAWDQNKNGHLPATWNCLVASTNPVLVGPSQ